MPDYYTFPCGCKFEILGPPIGKNTIPRLKWDIESTPTNCDETWKAISTGFTKGIFQLESELGKNWSREISPDNLDDLGAISALIRPGCLASYIDGKNLTQHFADRKAGNEPIAKFHDTVDNVLLDTYGILTYQEQAMRLVQEVALFSEQEADALRKAIGKKLPEEMAKVKKLFLEKAKSAGIISDAQAIEIFDWIEKSQRYSFNKCLSPNTIVETSLGEFKTIEDINIGEQIKAPNNNSYKYVRVINKYNNGKKKMYKTILESGKTIISTIDHKFLCDNGEILPLYEILHRKLNIVSDGV